MTSFTWSPRALFLCILLLVLNSLQVSGMSIPQIPEGNETKYIKPHPGDIIETDVVIVGAGFSGLMAARQLHKAGLKTVVLEADKEIGGKSKSRIFGQERGVIEMGAVWINTETQSEIGSLVKEFGLDVERQYAEGYTVFQDPGPDGWTVGVRYEEDAFWSYAPHLQEAENEMRKAVAEAAEQTDIYNWENFPEDQDVTFAMWLHQRGLWNTQHKKHVAASLANALVDAAPEDIGAHYFFDYIKSSGGLGNLTKDGVFGERTQKVKQGTMAIAYGLANTFPGQSIALNSPAARIEQRDGVCWVATKSGPDYKARKVMLAIPPSTYKNIEFEPPFPEGKHKIVLKAKMGVAIRMVFAYATPWWRKYKFSGIFNSPFGYISSSWDSSDVSKGHHSLTFSITGEQALSWHKLPGPRWEYATNTRVDNIQIHLKDIIDDVRFPIKLVAEDMIDVRYRDWTNMKYLGGGSTDTFGPGYLRKYGTWLRKPFEDLHFAGAETAYEWKGHMEGALRAGKRAAAEVIESLA